MATFRELEALVAFVDLRSLQGAARSLDTSQSAVARLLSEFEARYPRPLLDRRKRPARLTPDGKEVLRLARAVLRKRADLVERFCDADRIAPTLRLGITELAAATWIPGFVQELRARHGNIELKVVVGQSPMLQEMLLSGALDIALVVSTDHTDDLIQVPIGTARHGWYCSPTYADAGPFTVKTLVQQTLLLQGASTGAGQALGSWFALHAVRPASVIQSDSLAALTGIAAAGLGVANLPEAAALEAVNAGNLRACALDVETPDLDYVAILRNDTLSDFHRSIVSIACQCCDFNTPFQFRRGVGAREDVDR